MQKRKKEKENVTRAGKQSSPRHTLSSYLFTKKNFRLRKQNLCSRLDDVIFDEKKKLDSPTTIGKTAPAAREAQATSGGGGRLRSRLRGDLLNA